MTRSHLGRALALVVGVCGGAAHASPPLRAGPAATADELPALGDLLQRTGWTPTPELSGVFQAGAVFSGEGGSHALMLRDCFGATPVADAYPSIELTSSLQAGVRVRLGAGRLSGEGELVRKLVFGRPEHQTVERLALQPTEDCRARLAAVPADRLHHLYAVQEVLKAEISEQSCGRIDAEGRFVGLGAADAALARACTQVSLEPVAVAYRTVPLLELLPPPDGALAVAPARSPCRWGTPTTVSTTMTTLTINGETLDVRGEEARTFVVQELQRCDRPEAARAFEEWRRRRRIVNVSAATLVGMWPFGVGLLAAHQAEDWRLRTEALLLDPDVADEKERGWRKRVRDTP